MTSLRSLVSLLLRPLLHKRTPPTLLRLPDTGQPFEEELISDYNAKDFCPVSPGDVVGDGKYSIISKLGWGRNSTVWLAKDVQRWRWQPERYVSIKFNNSNRDQKEVGHEWELAKRVSTADPSHRGRTVVRKVEETFGIASDRGAHLCSVYAPLRETFEIYQQRWADNRIPISLVKACAYIMLVGLDYLHTKCNLIHTDLKLDNILISFEDEFVLNEVAKRFEHGELRYKETDGRRIFQSCNNFGPLRSYITIPIVTDFGSAVEGDFGVQPIQPAAYHAPEVILGWGWSKSVDIWNFGNLIWTMASGKDLFTSISDPEGNYQAMKHLANMYAVLGPPDANLVREQSKKGWKWSPPIRNDAGDLCNNASSYFGSPFFDPASGEFLHKSAVGSPQSLLQLATFVEQDEREGFVGFMKTMLTWDPSARSTAGDLASHPWLAQRQP